MPQPERFANPPTPGGIVPWVLANLAEAIDTAPPAGTQETWVFSTTPPVSLNQVGQYRFMVDQEILIDVSPVGSTNSRTVIRGAEGSTTATHSSGTPIYHVITAGVLNMFAAGIPPIGAVFPYAGSGDPVGGTNYVVADGRLIDRTIYVDFFNEVGHAYNGGIDPTPSGPVYKVKIPDLRGRTSVGAIDMGTGAGASGSQQLQRAQGLTGGSVTTPINVANLPSHSHSGSSATDNGHTHAASPDSSRQYVPKNGAVYSTTGVQANTGTTNVLTQGGGIGVGAIIATGNGRADINLSMAAVGGGVDPNTMPPYETDSWLVRIA